LTKAVVVDDAKAAKIAQKLARTRVLKRTNRQTFILAGKILALFVVASGFFLLTFLLSTRHVDNAVTLMPEQILAARRLNRVHLAFVYLANLARNPTMLDFFRPVSSEGWLRELRGELLGLRELQNALLYGSAEYKTHGSVKRYPPRDELDFGNACKYLPMAEVRRMDELDLVARGVTCETLADGVFTHGLNAAYVHFIDRVTALSSQLMDLTTDANRTRIKAFWHSDAVWQLEYMDRFFLHYGLKVHNEMFITEQLDNNVNFLDMQRGLLAGFLVLMALTYLFVYGPMIRSLDWQLKRVQSLLVMVPYDVIQTSVQLKKLLMV